MIGYLTGTVLYSDSQRTILLTSTGVGYEVWTSFPVVPGKKCELFISQIFREQSQDMYGFSTMEDKKFFELLLGVNGVGPKSAFGLVAHLGVQQIVSAITLENATLLRSAPGVGKRGAEQIILSLKDKIAKMELGFMWKDEDKQSFQNPHSMDSVNSSNSDLSLNLSSSSVKDESPILTFQESIKKPQKKKKKSEDLHLLKDALAAFQGLGFKDQDILPYLQKCLNTEDFTKVEDVVKVVLKELS